MTIGDFLKWLVTGALKFLGVFFVIIFCAVSFSLHRMVERVDASCARHNGVYACPKEIK